MGPEPKRLLDEDEVVRGARVALRLVTARDCTPRYVAWLADPEVHRFLETRWEPQPLERVRAFVEAARASGHSHLLAICDRAADEAHVGNIKLGPVDPRHGTADVSYFIGERTAWGRGLAREAIALVAGLGFARLGLARVEAGVYGANVGSARALERAGFTLEGRRPSRFASGAGRDDLLLYGLTREAWAAGGRDAATAAAAGAV